MAVSLRLRIATPGASASAVFDVWGHDVVLGRAPRCDLVLDNPRISAQHGSLRATGAGHVYTDLGSSNGSAVVRPGASTPEPAVAGELVPIAPGDILLLGASDDPIVLLVEAGPAAYEDASPLARTVVAAAPWLDLATSAPDAVVTLAAAALEAASPEALGDAALAFGRAWLPDAEGLAVTLAGPTFRLRVGDPLPPALADADRPRDQLVVERSERDAALWLVVVPLIAHGAWQGQLVAWRSGEAPLRADLHAASVAGALLALAVASVPARRTDRERVDRHPEASPIGDAPAWRETVTLAQRVAATDIPLLIVGETGTGKEVVARAIHQWSGRAQRPLVALNCAAVPDSLLESEIFGHVRGAFTGAATDRRGVFEQADGGTLFLDEIGDMAPRLQSKLLRVLEDGVVRRVGGDRAVRVDVRLLSATHRDLEAMASDGGFREDLLYRINAVTLTLPPLRERGADVVTLALAFLAEHAAAMGKRFPGLAPETLALLLTHPFPGNVRELRNEMARAAALTRDGAPIGPDALSPRLRRLHIGDRDEAPTAGAGRRLPTLRDYVETAERHAVTVALGEAAGRVSHAAKTLGLSRNGLYKLLDRLGLDRHSDESPEEP